MVSSEAVPNCKAARIELKDLSDMEVRLKALAAKSFNIKSAATPSCALVLQHTTLVKKLAATQYLK
jgi:hypothetical protein